MNHGKERRKLRWLPPPPSALAAASTAADESDREGEERAIERESRRRREFGNEEGMEGDECLYIYFRENYH